MTVAEREDGKTPVFSDEKKTVTVHTVKLSAAGKGKRDGKLRVAAYCRVSSDTEKQEGSLETQRASFEQEIKKEPGQVLVEVYADQGISGGSRKKRIGFNRMMQDCHAGKIDLIRTKSVSRFARNLADTVECIRELKQLGIPVVFEKEGLHTMEGSAEVVISMLAAIAQEELNHHSQNIKWSVNQNAKCGRPQRAACYGYRRKKEHETDGWEIYEPEAEKVRLIFQMVLEGKSYAELLEKLDHMEKEEGSAYRWSRNRCYRILKKEEYMGDILTHKYISTDYLTHRQVKNDGLVPQYYIEEHHAPIVDRHVYISVQELLKSRQRGVKKAAKGEIVG